MDSKPFHDCGLGIQPFQDQVMGGLAYPAFVLIQEEPKFPLLPAGYQIAYRYLLFHVGCHVKVLTQGCPLADRLNIMGSIPL